MNGLLMSFHDVFTNCQPQPTSPNFPAAGEVRSVKSFKNSAQVFFGNTGAVITDFYQYPLAVYLISACFYQSILFTIFNGIIYEVDQYLPDLFFVCVYCERQLAAFFNLLP